MKTTLTLLAVAAALVLPVAASAQPAADVAYRKKLAAVWRAYNDGADPAVAIATALSKCNTGAAASIPVIEKSLTDDGFKLPKK
jgi:hypothetical protein